MSGSSSDEELSTYAMRSASPLPCYTRDTKSPTNLNSVVTGLLQFKFRPPSPVEDIMQQDIAPEIRRFADMRAKDQESY